MSKNTLLFLTTLCLSVAEVYSQPTVEPDKFVDEGKTSMRFTCKDTLKSNEVLAWYRTGEQKVTTGPVPELRPIATDTTSILVWVRASQDAHIGLLNRTILHYAVVIGADVNSVSFIENNKTERVSEAKTQDILSDSEFRGFWVRWSKDELAVGRHGSDDAVVSLKNPDPFQFDTYGVYSHNESRIHWKIPGASWTPDDMMMSVTQNDKKEEDSVELILEKTLEPSDNQAWVYCAKQSVEKGGSFAKGGSESKRIPIAFKNDKLETPSIEIEPNDTKITFNEDTKLILKCSGSPAVDGREYMWFKKDLNSQLTIPTNQSYDAEKSSNVLTLSLNRSEHEGEVFCRQGYVADIRDPDGGVFVKSYGVNAESQTIYLTDGARGITNNVFLMAMAIIIVSIAASSHL